MQHIVINDQVLLVDAAYQDEPLDNEYPVYQASTGERVGSFEAHVLQKIATPVPACYASLYALNIGETIKRTVKSIDIRPVLRLMVHNNKFIHYLCGPTLLSDLVGREGGMYFAYDKDLNDDIVLYGGNTALELIQCMRKSIPLKKNGSVVLVHDFYSQEAFELLKTMSTNNDACQPPVLYSQWKDPSKLPNPEDRHDHVHHCKWCLEMGLNGLHGNYWANDGIVYDDRSINTAKSPYIQGVNNVGSNSTAGSGTNR